MSAKELGQIHTINSLAQVSDTVRKFNQDIPAELTQQLQRMVRQGQSFKVVGIDMTLSTVGTVGGGQVTGHIKYYAPTKGRCEAYRSAFKAMKTAMELQGITNLSHNKLYDFRVRINDQDTGRADDAVSFKNQATLDGTNGLCLDHQTQPEASVFGVHNRMVLPTVTGVPTGDLFASGFNTMGVQATPTDFVLNDTTLYSGNSNEASIQMESIPFMLTWSPDTGNQGDALSSVSFQWRPDPALYLSVLTGQLQFEIEEINVDGGASALELNINTMVSGWKSIMSTKSTNSTKSKSKRRRK